MTKSELMMISDTAQYHANKDHSVCVPKAVMQARIEILRSRGAPVFIGTELAKLHLENQTIILRSNMSGVVDRVCVDDNQFVVEGQELFEIRNCNVNREKAGNKIEMTYATPCIPRPQPQRANQALKPRPQRTTSQISFFHSSNINQFSSNFTQMNFMKTNLTPFKDKLKASHFLGFGVVLCAKQDTAPFSPLRQGVAINGLLRFCINLRGMFTDGRLYGGAGFQAK